jgi:hypothetical protein
VRTICVKGWTYVFGRVEDGALEEDNALYGVSGALDDISGALDDVREGEERPRL